MSQATSIEWCDATWNPVRGCSRVSEGCRNCYAERQAARFADFGCYAYGFAKRTEAGPRWTGRVELVPEKLDEPLRWKKPRRIFVNSMSDLFHERLSYEEIAAVFGVMAACPQHTFQVLTKRPERALKWYLSAASKEAWGKNPAHPCVISAGVAMRRAEFLCAEVPWPLPNVWLGVSVEDQATADERIPLLLQTPAAVRFVSYEPALAPVVFGKWLACPRGCKPGATLYGGVNGYYSWCGFEGIDWLIVGGESGPGARPFDVAWARSAVAQCKAAGVPVFVKQLGARPEYDQGCGDCDPCLGGGPCCVGGVRLRLILRDRKGGDPSEWPEDLRVREFPRGRT